MNMSINLFGIFWYLE